MFRAIADWLVPPGFNACQRRARRVTVLSLALVVLGLGDLVLTLTYMRSVGMIEANPLARLMLEIGGAEQLVRYKLFTIALSSGFLYLCRRHRFAEIGAWMCLAMLAALSVYWNAYSNEFARKSHYELLVMQADERWVFLGG